MSTITMFGGGRTFGPGFDRSLDVIQGRTAKGPGSQEMYGSCLRPGYENTQILRLYCGTSHVDY